MEVRGIHGGTEEDVPVRPGVTGWAQVNGRKDVEWHRRIKLNVWYVENVSFMLDVKILFRTIFKVIANADNVNVQNTLRADGDSGKGVDA